SRIRHHTAVRGRVGGLPRAGLLRTGSATFLEAASRLGIRHRRPESPAQPSPRICRVGATATDGSSAHHLREGDVAVLKHWLGAFVVATALIVPGFVATPVPQASEYELKAVCLFYFAKFT